MNLHDIYKNFFVASVSRLITAIVGLVIISFLTRYLGQAGYGAYETVLSYLFIFTVLADFGLHVVHVREISRHPKEEKFISSNIFTLRLISLFIVIVLALIIGKFLPYPKEVKDGIMVASIFVLFSSLSQILSGIFQKYNTFYFVSFADILTRLIQLGLVFYAIRFGYGFPAFIWILSLTAAMQFGVIFLISRRFIKFSLALDIEFTKKILKTSLPVALSLLFTAIYIRTDVLMLSLMKSQSEVGIFRLASKLLEAVVFFPALLVELTMPSFSHLALGAKELFSQIFKKTFNILLILAIPTVVFLIVLSRPIIFILGGNEFIDSALPLKILALVVGLVFLNNLGGKALIAADFQKTGMWIYISGAILNIGLNFLVIPKFGYLGAAFTTLMTEILVTTAMFYVLYVKIGFSPEIKKTFKLIIAGLAMSLVAYYFDGQNILAPLVLGSIAYFSLIYLLGCISKEELREILKPQRV